MSNNKVKTAFVELVDEQLKYAYFSYVANEFIWKSFFVDKKSDNVQKIIYTQLLDLGYNSIIFLPELKLFQEKLFSSSVILISKGDKSLFTKLYPNIENFIWEVNEIISTKGTVNFELSEPEINKALRFVFSKKPQIVYISLSNSIFNSIHERNLHNVLNHSGYKTMHNYTTIE